MDNEALTVTKPDPKSRTVFQLNGLPATHEYARLLGVDPEKLSANYFAASPVITSIDGINYVRSIQKSNPDESLTFHCAIEEGMKLRASGSIGLIETVRNTFCEIQNKLGEPVLTLVCDCDLRRLEATQRGKKELMANLFRENNVAGFSTYGEQFNGVHINQTLTGIAFGKPR